MRRGYRNRWEYDGFPANGETGTKNGKVYVNPTTGLWHNVDTALATNSRTQRTIALLREFGQLGTNAVAIEQPPVVREAKVLPEPLKKLGRLGYPE